MKKSQVLAALALAFALGVVAPVASTYATTTSSYENCVEANNKVYDYLNNFGKEKGKNYDDLVTMIADVKAFENMFAPAASDLSNALNGLVAAPATTDALYPTYAVASYVLVHGGLINNRVATVNDFAGKTYAEIAALDVHFPANVDPGIVSNYDWLKNTSQKSVVDTAARTASTALIGFGLTNGLVASSSETVAADLYAYIGKLTSLNNVIRIYDEFVKLGATGACSSQDDAVVVKATNELNSLLGIIGNNTNNNGNNSSDGAGNGSNNQGGNKAPDTGILADAEGSASTTVAMVAGVATALTAAGAGVVAYRNARRSTRK